MLQTIPNKDLLCEQAIRNARGSYEDYIRYTMPEYEWGWFNEYLSYELQRFYSDYLNGLNPRLMILAPPRSGKSEQCSRRFPTWLLGQNPDLSIISCSYSSDLSNSMSRDCQRIIETPSYSNVFPDTTLNSSNRRHNSKGALRTVEMWEILDRSGETIHGSYRAAGVNMGITGLGYDIGIMDDPVKNYRDASSKTYQRATKEWYDTTFYTRRNPKKNGILLIMTRWHKHDLGGQILADAERGGDKFRILRFPMEATKRECIRVRNKIHEARQPGDILFPQRMPPEYVEQCKVSSLTWSALYQQDPTIAGGNFFEIDHWKYYSRKPKFSRMAIFADTAQKKKEHNDFTVFQVWGLYEGNIYLVYQSRGKWHSHELLAEARRVWADYGGGIKGPIMRASSMYIEDKSSGTGLIQDLKVGGFDRRVSGLKHKPIPCIAIKRSIDKATRAYDAQPYIASGMVYLPEKAEWLSDYLIEFEEFSLDSKHAHDDQVDPTMDAIQVLLKGKSGNVNYEGFRNK